MLSKLRYKYVSREIEKLRKKKKLIEKEEFKIAKLYAEQCTYEMNEMRGKHERRRY